MVIALLISCFMNRICATICKNFFSWFCPIFNLSHGHQYLNRYPRHHDRQIFLSESSNFLWMRKTKILIWCFPQAYLLLKASNLHQLLQQLYFSQAQMIIWRQTCWHMDRKENYLVKLKKTQHGECVELTSISFPPSLLQ